MVFNQKLFKKFLTVIPLTIFPIVIASSCSFNKADQPSDDSQQKPNDPENKFSFGTWDNQTLDLASADFWNRPDIIAATQATNEFNIWKELALANQSAQLTMQTEIRFMDVGQADATLIKVLPKAGLKDRDYQTNSFNILIDSGNFKVEKTTDQKIYSPFYQTKLKPTLDQELVNDKIDLFMFSHAHADHIGQASQVIRDFAKPNRSIVINWGDIDQNSSGFRNLIKTTINKSLIYLDPFVENAIDVARIVNDPNFNDPKKNDIFSQFIDQTNQQAQGYGKLSDPNDLKSWQPNPNKLFKMLPSQNIVNFAPDNFFAYLAPQSDYEPNQPNHSENENSINALFKLANQTQDYRIIFTGDAEGHTHQDMLNAINQNQRFQDQDPDHKLSVDLYKVAHHGSTTEQSNNLEFLKAITKANTQFVIQTNDHKLFSNSPTLKTKFFENLQAAALAKNLELNQSVLITQNLGDIVYQFDNQQDLKAPKILTFNRQEQINLKHIILKPNEQMTIDLASLYKPADQPDQYEKLIYQAKAIY